MPYQFFLNLPFGETMAEQYSLTEDYETPYKFNGKELDAETGLYYYGARYYDPHTSIWLSVDPLMEKYPGWNPYNYTMQNPINLVDPTGMGTEDIIDIDKKTGNITVTEAKGNDVVRLVDKGKVVDSYIYGDNGSFKDDNWLSTEKFTDSNGKSCVGQLVASTNNTKSFTFFKFAAKSDVEFSYNKYIDVDTNVSASIVATSHDDEREAYASKIKYDFLVYTENINLVETWHSHPGKYDISTGWPAYPSGFYYNGKIRSGEIGDRDTYNWNKMYFPKRTPLYNYIYIPSANKIVKYNGKTFTVK